jgi:ATP-dependent DNA helicase RecG
MGARHTADANPGQPAAPLPPQPAAPLHGQPVLALPGVGAARAARLAALGVETVGDLLRLAPRRYDDRTRVTDVAEALRPQPAAPDPPPPVLLRVRVQALSAHRPRAGLTMLRARVADATGALDAVWFNQPHLRRLLRPGAWLYLYGRVQRVRGRPQLAAPEVEPDDGRPALAGQLVPVYPLTAGLSQRAVRTLMRAALARAADDLAEPLPAALRVSLGLPHAAAAIRILHAPPDADALAAARRRLALQELLCLQVGLGLRRRARAGLRRPFRYAPAGEASRLFRRGLPFALTAAQARVLGEIEADLQARRPMYRLLQGDVGSGKTVVAAAALLRALESGRQAALMAPTEILAEQHHRRIGPWLGPLGARVRLLTGRMPQGERARILEELERGEADLVVGTHALIQAGVRFRALGLVVTDEQHRFGVRQRDLLHAKGERPDVLAMTATPIWPSPFTATWTCPCWTRCRRGGGRCAPTGASRRRAGACMRSWPRSWRPGARRSSSARGWAWTTGTGPRATSRPCASGWSSCAAAGCRAPAWRPCTAACPAPRRRP